MPGKEQSVVRLARGTSTTKSVDGATLNPAKLTQEHFRVDRLEGTRYPNPMLTTVDPQFRESMLNETGDQFIAFDPLMRPPEFHLRSRLAVQKAAARATLHFDPATTCVGIVTCGGLCPGLNDVVRAITHACLFNYGVKRVYGFRYGFWGLSAAGRHTALELSRTVVSDIHRQGGSFLGSSRGPQKKEEMIETLVQLGINVLFCVGGDGTQRGAMMLAKEARARGLDIAVMGIPKTIDNDLAASQRTFGFETAVEQAVTAIRAVHCEATSVRYGVGICKVMGRHSGFIAAQSTLASEAVNICLIPENPISLETVLELIATRFLFATHCTVCVAEGFGQEWFQNADGSKATDASGNQKLVDIGTYLAKAVEKWLKTHKQFGTGTVKYVDPSYMVRGCPPNSSDAAFCVHLANLAVHEALYGSTNCVITNWYNNYCVVPTVLATSLRRVVNTHGLLWKLVREMTVGLLDRKEMEDRARRLAENEIRAAESTVARMKSLISKL